MIGWLCVLFGAAVGAPARYLVDRSIQSRHETLMPWGTMTVNLLGCGILGLLNGMNGSHTLSSDMLLLAGTGLCGAFTTFSTYTYESLRLYQTGARTQAALNVVVSIVGGLGAVTIGYSLGASF